VTLAQAGVEERALERIERARARALVPEPADDLAEQLLQLDGLPFEII
jgi:hypothetical protein